MAVQSQDLLFQFDMAVRDWGNHSIETLTSLEAATWQEDEYEFNKMIARVSGLIDQGRLLLPNTSRDDGKDLHKPEAYKGYRPPVLENLYAVYDYAAGLSVDSLGPEAARELYIRRRAFVAELVVALDTKRNKSVIHKLDKAVRSQFSASIRNDINRTK